MSETWQDLLCRLYYAGYEDCQRERDYDPMGNEVVDATRIRAEKMDQRIRELEALLETVLDCGSVNDQWWVDRVKEVLEQQR